MSRATTAQRDLAKRLLLQECTSSRDAEPWLSIALRLRDKLFGALVPIIGEAGVTALFARGVTVTKAELSSRAGTAAYDVRPSLDFLGELEPDAVLEAATCVYATFLALLMSFIGERLTRQLLTRIVPAIDDVAKETT